MARLFKALEQKEKEQAINYKVLYALKSLLYGDGDYRLKLWKPRATFAYATKYFQNEKELDAFLADEITKLNEIEKEKQIKRDARKGNEKMWSQYGPGTIFHFSWGYDQTNCEFFQVIERKGQFVTIAKITSETVPGSESFMSDRRIAVKDSFTGRQPQRKKLQFHDGKAFLTMASYGWCDVWDGTPQTASWYA